MSRNAQSRFSLVPSVNVSRSRFDRNSSVKLTFNVGDVVPFYVDEVLPGDTFSIDTSKVVRMQTLLTPMMDNIYLDTYWFYVPNRLTWSHWKEFMGENSESAWIPEVEYSVPQLTAPDGGWAVGTIADYMGVPTGVENLSVNALPFRAYALIMDEWFRDQNLTDPLKIPVTDAAVVGSNGTNYITDIVKGGMPFRAAKYHDYFTSCLPAPQKGPDVQIPVATPNPMPVVPMSNRFVLGDVPGFSPSGYTAMNVASTYNGSQDVPISFDGVGDSTGHYTQGSSGRTNFASPGEKLVMDNIYAVGDGSAAVATINQLRMAFAVQRLYERDARGGTRYTEILKSHFGVQSPDSRLQRPEYLGGNRIPITINQVLQQSETATTPQGTTTGQSLTTDKHSGFTQSFVEHGFVIGLMVARYDHTYQQGLERFWSRKGRFDYYWPVFANLGEQAVLNKEIFAQGTAEDDQVFGYQEAWADYRYKPSRVCGEMRSSYPQSLDIWHLADDYSTLPALSDGWIREDSSTVDRVIAVSSQQAQQLFGDVYIANRTARPMPLYSVPGLIDHN